MKSIVQLMYTSVVFSTYIHLKLPETVTVKVFSSTVGSHENFRTQCALIDKGVILFFEDTVTQGNCHYIFLETLSLRYHIFYWRALWRLEIHVHIPRVDSHNRMYKMQVIITET